MFLGDLERIVPEWQRFHALDFRLRGTRERWWETHKENMGNWEECACMTRLRFECLTIRMEEVYYGKDDPCRHLARWNQVRGVEPRHEWVYMLIDTLGKVAIDWYLEIELRRGTNEWSTLTERFILTFIF